MCGIAGFIGTPSEKRLTQLLVAIEHRGRDERAVYTKGHVHIGMNRLAIVDLRKGLYPIRYKHYVLLYNGEIYNHVELRQTLTHKNIHPPIGCDAYVILPLYDLYGPRTFAMLEGMFAISIYDTKKKEIILARDKSGEKPLYYLYKNGFFAFSSEVNALFPLLSNPHINSSSTSQYLAKGYVFGKQTLLEDVKKVLASEYVVYSDRSHKLRVSKYWQPSISKNTVRKTQNTTWYIQKLQSLIEHSVQARMLSDVPVGCFMSGGIDSAIIAYFASQYSRNLRTYSIAFPNQIWNDESFFARFAARHLNTQHTEVLCTPQSIRPIFEKIGDLIDEPISDPGILPTLLLSQEARKSVKVVLTGEGGDEVLAGYPRHVRQLAIEYVRNRSNAFGPLLALLRVMYPNRFTQVRQELEVRYKAQRIWSETERGLLNRKWNVSDSQIYYSNRQCPDTLLRMQVSDYRGYLSEQLFMKADKSTMAYNLESRAPYVDTDILNFAFGLPFEYKVKWLQSKYLLKRVASLYFPWWFVWRPKHGFSVPLKHWFSDELKEFAILSVENIRQHAPSVDVDYYESVVRDHIARRKDNADKIWNMYILGSWLKRHKLFL